MYVLSHCQKILIFLLYLAWTKSHRMVLSLPDGKTKTVAISQAVSKRYWFGICPVSSKIGNLKMCGGCQWVGYVGKEEQKEHWPCHKQLCKILKSFTVSIVTLCRSIFKNCKQIVNFS